MKNFILHSNNDWAGLITRLFAGIILFPHGAQKMLGLFGGYGFQGTMDFFVGTMHLPAFIAFLVICIEFFGAIALLLGFAGRVWALLVAVLMLGIILTSHLNNGFFMNWYGGQAGEGFEFHLLMIGLALTIAVNGSGRYSLDSMFGKRAMAA